MSRSPLAWALALALSAAAAADEPAAPPLLDPDEQVTLSQSGRGPLEVQDVYLLALNRLSPWARAPQVLGHLQVEAGLRGVWTNSFAFGTDRLRVDGEVRQAIATLRLGLFDRLELGLWLPYEWRGGGSMDQFIEGFHKTFDLPGADRDRVPKNRYFVGGYEADGHAFHYDHKGYGFSDLILEARGQLVRAPELPAVTGYVRLRLPTGRPKFELSDGVDVTLGVDASLRLGRSPFLLYAGAAYTYYAEARVGGLALLRHRGFFTMGLEIELTSWLSLVTHLWVESPRETKLWRDPGLPAGTFPSAGIDYGNYVTYVAAGFKVEPTPGLMFEIGMLENIVDPEITADFTVLANLVWRFGGEKDPAPPPQDKAPASR